MASMASLALEPDRVEVGQLQVRDQLWHAPPSSVRPTCRRRRLRLVEPAPVPGDRGPVPQGRDRAFRRARGRAASLTLAAATRLSAEPVGPGQSVLERRVARRAKSGRSSALGARWASAAAARLAVPGITTARPAASPSTAALATSAGGTHMNFGSDSPASSSVMPAASAKPVSTGPGHSVVTVTPRAAQLGAERAPVGEDEGLRRAVAGLSGQRLEGRGRRRVEDRPAVPRHHARHEERAQVDHRLDVRAHHGELGGAVGPVHRAHRREAGVVDEDVGREAAPSPAPPGGRRASRRR